MRWIGIGKRKLDTALLPYGLPRWHSGKNLTKIRTQWSTQTHTLLAIQISAFPHFFLSPSPLTISPLFSFLSISLHLCSVSFSFPGLFCLCFGLASVMADSNPMDCSLPGSSVHGILQARILEWVANPFFRGSSWPMDQNWVSCSLRAEP